MIGNPEFSYYAKNNFTGGDVPAIPTSDVIDYFTASSTPKSFLNPVSLKFLFDNYDDNNYKAIISRFNMINETEIDAIIGYFNQIVKDQIQYSAIGGTYEQSAFAKLIVKALNNSFMDVQMNTLYELTSRYVAAALQVNNQDCNYYISKAVTDPARVTKICTDFNFRNLANLKNFINPFYYNNGTA